jgi:hypothetical protein
MIASTQTLSDFFFFFATKIFRRGGFLFDEEDGSVTRSDFMFRRLFERAGYDLVKVTLQTG